MIGGAFRGRPVAVAVIVCPRLVAEELQMRQTDVAQVLNDLIETTKDSVHGFQTCAAHAEADVHRQAFERRAAVLSNHIAELNDMVLEYGGRPALHGSAVGAMHRGWMRLKEALGGITDAELLDECQRGEAHALGRYRAVLARTNLPEAVRELLAQQADEIQAHWDELRRQQETSTA
jgi:uncharacterized protein (TIGR02284 family)